MPDWTPKTGYKRVGKPFARWEDGIQGFARGRGLNWRVVAEVRDSWERLENDFVKWEAQSARAGV